MKSWRNWLRLALYVLLSSQVQAEHPSPGTFDMMVQNTSSTIYVTWKRPDKTANKNCYRTHIQHRRHCDTSWKDVSNLEGFTFELQAPDMKKNYAFRLRTRLSCVNSEWSEWSPEKYWKNNTDLCITKTPINIKNYVLIFVLPIAGALLLYAITQGRLRRCLLPIIPDPMHTQDTILNVEEIQHCSSLPQPCEDCKLVEILLVCEQVQEDTWITEGAADESLPRIQSMRSTSIGYCERDLTAESASPFSTSPCLTVPPEHTVALLCSSHMQDYVVL